MSDRILKALMQLFAIIAKIDNENVFEKEEGPHQIIRTFLRVELASDKIEQYVELFDHYYRVLRARKTEKYGADNKRTSVQSVKVLRICHEINKELTNRQKFIVLMRIMELILQDDKCSEVELDFLKTVADTFKIDPGESSLIFSLLRNEISTDTPVENSLVVSGKTISGNDQILLNGLDAPIICILIRSNNFIFFKYLGEDDIYLNGQLLDNRKAFLFTQGASLKTSKSGRLYQVDILNRFLSAGNHNRFIFEAREVSYRFQSGVVGVESFSCRVESGKLVGIMGASGTGKSTLVNLLNGSKRPNSGTVTVNGTDIYRFPKELEGLIGYVSQDDLLMEELTVFQNLYYSAKLCFGELSDNEVKQKVLRTLSDLNLSSVKHLKVGNPLKKIISGGQRKRLNIALELIRNPSILFLDEPTSGLSSSGSLRIMNLLKDLSQKGTLVFVVIHQPSSDVFKLLNQLIIMDYGGYQIFDGIPSEAITHFKKSLEYANPDDQECPTCGNIKVEQIFETIESQVVNELGIPTNERKFTPKKWREVFLRKQSQSVSEAQRNPDISLLPNSLKKTSLFKQFLIFFIRDSVSKISNRQYVLFVLIQAPVLAFIMSFFLKYYVEIDGVRKYIYYYNENIPIYLFVSVLSSIFLGMTMAAEEINKDRKNLKREKFLNLSWGSYLLGKVVLLSIISAIQSFLFVLIGNSVLEIKELWQEHWLILFSTSVCANIFGLNISSAFRQTKIIYIIIPVMIIPQMIFSGLIIRYDRMHPVLSHPHEVPWIGNLMISRWANEALVVEFASENTFSSPTFELYQKSSEAQWRKDYWIPEMNELVKKGKDISIIRNEVQKEELKWKNLNCDGCFDENKLNEQKIKRFLSVLQLQYTNNYNILTDSIDHYKQRFGLKKYNLIREKYDNESLEQLVNSKNKIQKLYTDVDKNTIFQLKDPIYQSANGTRFLDAPYLIKEKAILGVKLDTFWSNSVVLWFFIVFFYLTLQFKLFKKMLNIYRMALSVKNTTDTGG